MRETLCPDIILNQLFARKTNRARKMKYFDMNSYELRIKLLSVVYLNKIEQPRSNI